jgi:hypothetical protein
MKLKSIAAALALASLCAASAYAEPVAPLSFADQLAQAGSPLTVRPEGFSGPGAAILSEAVGASRYVLIGESHHSREIPAFTTNVCRLMAPGGLTAMVVEIGPEAAGAVNARLRAPDREQQISDFMSAHPDAMAFLNGRDEGQTAADCAGAAGPEFKLWGLDQEFFGVSGYLFEQMLAAGPGPLARAQIEALAKQERTATQAALASGSPMDLFLFKVSDATLDQAGAAIDQDGGDRAKALFAALRETRAIYQASLSRSGDPNGRRARLMKRTLAAHLAEAPQARVLMKFGAYHLYKGFNPLEPARPGQFRRRTCRRRGREVPQPHRRRRERRAGRIQRGRPPSEDARLRCDHGQGQRLDQGRDAGPPIGHGAERLVPGGSAPFARRRSGSADARMARAHPRLRPRRCRAGAVRVQRAGGS